MPLSGGWLPAGLDLLLACLARLPGWPPGQVARTQAPSRRVRPLPSRVRRVSAAGRRLRQAGVPAAPPERGLRPGAPEVAPPGAARAAVGARATEVSRRA